jgi:hypothetical protein
VSSIAEPRFSPLSGSMPNLHGPLSTIPFGSVAEFLLGAAVVVSCWRIARRTSFTVAFACCAGGGLLLSFHSYIQDALVLLPAALAILATAGPVQRALAVLLILPPVYAAFIFGMPASLAVVLAIVLFLCLTAWRPPATAA